MELDHPANHCFGCGPGNPIGLQIRFHMDGDVCRAEFTPGDNHVGYDGVVHGGILYTALDDVMANWLVLQGDVAFTARCEIRYRAALPPHIPLDLEGHLVKRRSRLVQVRGLAIRQDTRETVCEADGTFMLPAA